MTTGTTECTRERDNVPASSDGRSRRVGIDWFTLGSCVAKVFFAGTIAWILASAAEDAGNRSVQLFTQSVEVARGSANEDSADAAAHQALASTLTQEAASQADDERWLLGGAAALGLLTVTSVYSDASGHRRQKALTS